jgi:hypothetical protein
MHIGSGGLHRVDEACVLVLADVDLPLRGLRLHPEIPLVALFGLMHLRIPLPGVVPRGARSGDQGGINDCPLSHLHAPILEIGLDCLKDLIAQFVPLEQMPERQDRRLIRDPIVHQVDPRETAHAGHLDQGLLHGWVAQRVPLLHQVDPQHGGQWVGRPASLLAGFGLVRLDQLNQPLQGHPLLHLGEELLAPGALFGRGLLVIGESKLPASHHPMLPLVCGPIVPWMAWVFQSLPKHDAWPCEACRRIGFSTGNAVNMGGSLVKIC